MQRFCYFSGAVITYGSHFCAINCDTRIATRWWVHSQALATALRRALKEAVACER